jgi:Flp pilus assembly protein TadG
VLVIFAVGAALFFALLFFLYDSTVLAIAHIELSETLQQAADEGVQQIDRPAYRENGQTRLIQGQAQAVAETAVRTSEPTGLEMVHAFVTSTDVRVNATLSVPLLPGGAWGVTLVARSGFRRGL